MAASPKPLARSAAALGLAAALACSGRGETPPAQQPTGGTCTLPPAAQLSVTGSTPAPNQNGVVVNVSVHIQFNTCLDPATITGANVSIFPVGGLPVTASVSYDPSNATLVIDPAQDLAYSSSYGVSISSGVRGAHAETMAYHAFTFATQSAPETVPPVTTASPAGGFYNAAQQVTLACQDNPGGTGCAKTYYTLDGTTPTAASPVYQAPIAVDHTLTLTFFSVDMQGNAESPKSASFVIDTTPPAVVSVSPAANATGVSLLPAIQIVFDEPMKVDQNLRGSVTAVPSVNGSSSYDPATRTLTSQVTALLECNTKYTITVSGATDLAGNALAAPTTWSFTTANDCDEPRTTANLPSGAFAAEQDVTLTCTDGTSGCARIVYTTDGSVPSFTTGNGIFVDGATAGPIHVGPGETVLRFRAQDAVGHGEVIRERQYSVSTQGFTYAATVAGLNRGVGPVPARFITMQSQGLTAAIFRDASSGRIYRVTNPFLAYSEDGLTWSRLDLSKVLPSAVHLTAAAADGTRLYVGTDQGLYLSTNGGESFEAARHFGWYDADWVTDIAVSGVNVYATTRQGMVVSHDRFRSYTGRSTASFKRVVTRGDDVFATNGNGVDVSHDAGVTWTTVTAAPGATQNVDVAASGTSVFVATDVGLAVSSTNGDSFTGVRTTANGLDANNVNRVFAVGSNVYVGTWGSVSTGKSFAVSTNGGSTFVARSVGVSGGNVVPQALLVENSTVWVGGSPSLWRSTDGGATFDMGDLPGNSFKRVVGSGPDLYTVVADSGAFGGIAISHDRGTTWTFRGNGKLPDSTPVDVFLDGSTLYVGTWDGLALSTDGGTTFTVRNQTNSGLSQSTANCVVASGSTIWTCGLAPVQESTNGGTSFTTRVTASSPKAIAFSGQDVYVADYGGTAGLWVSHDGGTTFAVPAAGLPNTYLADVAIGPDGKVYVADQSGIDVSTDNGATFTPIAAAASCYPSALLVTSNALYVAGRSKLGISTDGGGTFTWRDSTSGLASSPNDVYFGP